jgi:hypothetical protein
VDALKRLALATLLLWNAPVHADPIEQWRPLIAEASDRFALPEDWIVRVMRVESGGRTMLDGHPITSHAGAMGLMQLMPETWAEMRMEHGLGVDPHEPRDNILAGTAYLRAMYDRFGYPGLFAAYNTGPDRYAEHLRTGRPLPDETRTYLARVAHPLGAPSEVSTPSSGTRLFFDLKAARNTVPDEARTSLDPARESRNPKSQNPDPLGLFVPLRSASGPAQ